MENVYLTVTDVMAMMTVETIAMKGIVVFFLGFYNKKCIFSLGVIQPTSSTCYNFSCDNGECVPDIHRCNGHNDCGDNSDENDCGIIIIIKLNIQNVGL